MIPNNSLIVSPTEPTGKNRKKVWMQNTDTDKKIYIKHSNDVYEEFTKAYNGYYGCEYKEYSGINLDNMIISGSGMFVCKNGCTNTPTYSGVTNMHWFVIQITGFTNYAVQIATGVHTNTNLYIRHCIYNSWSDWAKISSTTI